MTDDEKFLAECESQHAGDTIAVLCEMVRDRDALLSIYGRAQKVLEHSKIINEQFEKILALETQLKWATENQQGRDIKIENSPREKALESALRESEEQFLEIEQFDFQIGQTINLDNITFRFESMLHLARAARAKIKEVLG